MQNQFTMSYSDIEIAKKMLPSLHLTDESAKEVQDISLMLADILIDRLLSLKSKNETGGENDA